MTLENLLSENAELRLRLEEAQETLRAIQTGAIDALVVQEASGCRVYTLDGADRPYRLLVEQMRQGAATLHTDGTIAYSNQRLAELLKIPHEKLIGTLLNDYVAASDHSIYCDLLQQGALRTGSGEARLQQTDGKLVPVYMTINVLPEDCGSLIGVLITDLTTQRHHEQLSAAHEALRTSDKLSRLAAERLRLAMDAAEMGSWEWNVDKNEITLSEKARQLFDLTSEEPISFDEFSTYLHTDDVELNRQAAELALTTGKYNCEYRILSPLGSTRWIDSRGTMFSDADGATLLLGIVIDSTERRQAEAAALKVQEIFKLVHGIGRIGHWEWDSQSDENKWSPEMEALYGLPPGGFDGTYQAWKKLLHPDDLPKAEEAIQRSMETGEYFTEFRVIWSDGSVHWLETRACVFKDSHGRPVRILGVNMDITERKQIEESLKDADRRKDEFLATLAHELRNPLAPLRNGLQLMKLAKSDSETVARSRVMMERQLEQMVRLIDDLMDLSRISRGKVELRKKRIDLAKVIEQAVETSRPLIDSFGHELIVDLPLHPITVDADLIRLAQVFSNLLNNAAKYSEQGGRIHLSVARQGSDVVASVKDTGIGISRDQLPHIFEMFSQVDRSLEKAHGGLGIGLTLVKRLMELHGGSVTAKSDGNGLGSEFIVRMPILNEAHPPKFVINEEPMMPKSSLRIMIVDDNRDGADSLGIMLRFMGNDIRTAYDGQQGVELAREYLPDVALFDIGLPKLNGYEACRRIREQQWGKDIVLVAVTGWGQDEDRRRSHEAGFDFHLVKPVEPQALMQMLSGLAGVKS